MNHPEWYYSHYDKVFSRRSGYDAEIEIISSLVPLDRLAVQEIGAGTGEHASRLLANNIAHIDLLDNDDKAVSLLKRRFKGDRRTRVIRRDGFIRTTDVSYDLVYCMYSIILQGVANLGALADRIRLVSRRISPGGAFLFEIIDCDASQKVYRDGIRTQVYKDAHSNDAVFVETHYGSNTLTIQYSGELGIHPIAYETCLLNVTRDHILQVGESFGGMSVCTRSLDEYGRRILVKISKSIGGAF